MCGALSECGLSAQCGNRGPAHDREARGRLGSIIAQAPWLMSASVLNLSGILGVDMAKVQRRLGPFPADRLQVAKTVLARMLGFEQSPS